MNTKYPFSNASDSLKKSVWKKGKEIDGYNKDTWRRDKCGHAMKYSDHGQEGKYGWEIDHINPSSRGGSNEISNLQPLWWSNNRKKGDTYPWFCS